MLDWETHAHSYQRNGAAHLWNSTATLGAAVLWLDPGYGKTMIVLHAFKALYDAGLAKNMLIVAPLRVVQTVWAQEIENWASLKGLVAARLHGPKKESQLKRRDVNIWLINYEGIPWLAKLAKSGKIAPYDVVTFDEVRRMKNAQGKRFKAIRPLAAMAKYRWGLTGTPASNGLLDLFGQFLILDDGASLGNRITHYRHEFFEKHFDGFTWLPRPGAKEAIEARIEPYIFRADGHLDLPEFVWDHRAIPLDAKARKEYTTLKQNLITQLGEEGTVLTAANAAVLMGKLKQMANGRVYDEDRNVIEVHSAKADALRELVEELGDEQLLIAYEYNHDLTQIREVLGDDLPYLGAGVSETVAMANVERWNAGEIQFMAAHPASAGHGLNLQKGGAHHILWFGPTFDLDHFIQFNDRLRRQGNQAESVVIHTFVTERSVDETAIAAREEKATLQDALLKALTVEFGDSITLDTTTMENTMDLQFKSDAQQAAPAQPAAAANPFTNGQAQAAPAQDAQAANPFTNGQAQTAPAQDAAPANPFANQGAAPAPTQQVQNIQQEVAAPAPQQPVQTEAGNPFANAAAQTGQAPVENVPEAEVVAETPPPAQTTAPTPGDTGWQEPAAQPAANHTEVPVATGDGEVYVPVNVVVPAWALDKVLSAIGRACKPSK